MGPVIPPSIGFVIFGRLALHDRTADRAVRDGMIPRVW
ncbi:hypothetical protein [Bradyrhizobium campsiandrae]|nr:hypothetical protein [Bradyrhizobium campsiandrae]